MGAGVAAASAPPRERAGLGAGVGVGEAVFGREEFGGEAFEDLRLLLPDGDQEGAFADREGIDALAGRDDAAFVLLFLLGETLDEPLAVEDEDLRLFAELVVDLKRVSKSTWNMRRAGQGRPGWRRRFDAGGVGEVEASGADLFRPLDGGKTWCSGCWPRACGCRGRRIRASRSLIGEVKSPGLATGLVSGAPDQPWPGAWRRSWACRGRVGCRRRLIAGGVRGRVGLRVSQRVHVAGRGGFLCGRTGGPVAGGAGGFVEGRGEDAGGPGLLPAMRGG